MTVSNKASISNLPGITSLVTKTTFLGIAIVLASFGIQTTNPFLIHCLDESVINGTNRTDGVVFCDFDPETLWPNCVANETELNRAERLKIFAESLKRVEMENLEDKAKNLSDYENQLPDLEKIKMLRENVEKEIFKLGLHRLVQKVRICSKHESPIFGIKNENVFRISVLSTLLLLVASAVWATFRLHKIASYKVGFVLISMGFIGQLF